MTKPKITLDANAIINHYDRAHASPTSVPELEEIMRRWETDEIDVAITTRIEADLWQDKDKARRDAMLAKAEVLPIIGSVFRFGFSKLDDADGLMSDEHVDLAKQVEHILSPAGIDPQANTFPNKISDVDHLVGHKLAARDVFVTDDGKLNKKAADLAGIGIKVMRPSEALVEIDRILKGP
ncbi:hypothetical protein AO398_03410 [Methylobacterium sp. GXS13]|uniref:hypothetical protein n=1 Tax=Methylobacterium sp. GXS13 TaxID=1730094 RepID=UPI00071BCCD3|nr:hypothetical protein [Methylobacterium sp. GXS13]KST59940.1 hypothetical protein AO398_03410 [Methylobacterium sp. GXS13]